MKYLGVFGSIARGDYGSESVLTYLLSLIGRKRLVCLSWLESRKS